MGIIFRRTLICEHCGYVYRGRGGGHIISNGERYGISQYYCKTCKSIIDLECYSSLRENKEKYIYPDGKEVSYSIEKKRELNQENSAQNNTNSNSGIPPFCQKCGNHLFKLNIDSDEYAYCPECGHKSLKQKDIHVIACID